MSTISNTKIPLWPGLFAFPGFCLSFYFGNWLNPPACFVSFFSDLSAVRSRSPVIASAENYWEARSICIDPYWLNQWLKHYEFGLVKRGFLGSALKLFSGDQINVLILNIIFIAASLALILCIIFAIEQLTELCGWSLALFALLLSVSPVTKVVVETSGDPLHIIALACFSAILISKKLPDSNNGSNLGCLEFYT